MCVCVCMCIYIYIERERERERERGPRSAPSALLYRPSGALLDLLKTDYCESIYYTLLIVCIR